MKKILVAFYSRTGTTRRAAELVAQKIGADLEEIKDTADRNGAKGYLISGRDATLRRLTQLAPIAKNPGEYDLVIIGTPIWSWNLSVPVRTYLEENKSSFKETAFFCTMGGSGAERAEKEMEKIVGRKAVAALGLTTKEVLAGKIDQSVSDFVEKLRH